MLKNYSRIKVDEDDNKRYRNDEGKCHRLDGPAVEWLDGSKFWFINGNSHRNIDPSSEYSDGLKIWLFTGKPHHIGKSINSEEEIWYIHGKKYTKQEYFNKVWDI